MNMEVLTSTGKSFDANQKANDSGQYWAAGQPTGAGNCALFTATGLKDVSCTNWTSNYVALCEITA
jgi:hypothetical protein